MTAEQEKEQTDELLKRVVERPAKLQELSVILKDMVLRGARELRASHNGRAADSLEADLERLYKDYKEWLQ